MATLATLATLTTLASLHVHMWNMKMWTRGSWAALWSGVALLANTAYLAKPGLSYTFIWFIVVIMTSYSDHYPVRIITWSMIHSHPLNATLQSHMSKTVIICNAQSFVKDSKIWTRSLWHKFFQLFPAVHHHRLLRLIMFVIDRVEDTTKRPRVSACAPPGTLRPFCNVAAVAEEGKKYKSGQFHK